MWSGGLDRRALIAFLLAVLVQVAMAVGTWRQSEQVEQAANDVSARYKAVHAARLLEAEVIDADRAARRFVATGDPELRSSGAGEWADADEQRAALDARLATSEREDLDHAIAAWRAALDSLQDEVAAGGTAAVVEQLEAGVADRALKDVVSRIDRIADREEAEIVSEERQVAAIGWRVRRLTVAGDALSVTLVVGSVMALQRDAIRRRAAEADRERLIGELQHALAEVRQLSGMLPICAWCKKIRDDEGYWNEIESYVAEHSEAEFTHGICPECKARLDDEAHDHRHG